MIVIIRFKGAQLGSVSGYIEIMAPGVIATESWRDSIAENPTANGYSGYGILQDRETDTAITEGLRDLSSPDPYVWVNAASYLGSRERSEAIPYLIKALRHTAWRSDDETVHLLQELTKQKFTNDFQKWHNWYVIQPEAKHLD